MKHNVIKLRKGIENSDMLVFPKDYQPDSLEGLSDHLARGQHEIAHYDNYSADPKVRELMRQHYARLGQTGLLCVGIQPPLIRDEAAHLGFWCALNMEVDTETTGVLTDLRRLTPRYGHGPVSASREADMTLARWNRDEDGKLHYSQVAPRLEGYDDNGILRTRLDFEYIDLPITD